jgi:uncharacterized protein with ParB-like and HNH nuclease domain
MTNVTKTVFKVGDFVSWAKNKQLDLSPDFQRRSVWKSGAKSYLLDTIIRGLPIPIVFLRDKLSMQSLSTTREVVDGQQRLRAILTFIDPSLVDNYDPDVDGFSINKVHNLEFAGLAFNNLPEKIRKSIFGYEIPVHVFSADTEDRDVLQIFARMNSTGVKLNDQELRNAEYFGEFKTFCYRLAYENLGRWQAWGVFKLNEIARMIEVEEVSDLIISMHIGLHGKNKKIIDEYYRKYDKKFKYEKIVARRFGGVMDAIENSIGDDLATTSFARRTLFNDLFVATYHIMYGLGSDLNSSVKPENLPKNFAKSICGMSRDLEDGHVDEDVSRSLRGATAHRDTREIRVRYILGELGYVF